MSKNTPCDLPGLDDWPPGDHVSTACPYCGHMSPQQLTVVREEKMNCRDGHCDGCEADYHIEARGGHVTVHKTRLRPTPHGFATAIDPSTPLPV